MPTNAQFFQHAGTTMQPPVPEFSPLIVGNTPLVRLPESIASGAHIYAKLEYFNEAANIKMRPAKAMIDAAEQAGILKPFSGQTILESSGGSMGISLAVIGAQRGYNIKLVLPDNYNQERIRQLPIFGAEVVLSDSSTGNDSHFRLARKLAEEHPDHYFIDQLTNEANPRSHYETTGREIVEALPHIDYFICGIGSGGSITGIGRRIKERFPAAKIIGVQPAGCDVLKGKAIPHKIQGWAAGVLPPVLDISLIDGMLDVTYEAAMSFGHKIVRTAGYYGGISACANLLAARQLSETISKEKIIVTLVPDFGSIYLSHYLNFLNNGN